MSASSYQLHIVTPQGISYTGQVAHVNIPIEGGSVGVLANHAPYITASPGGKLVLRDEEGGQTIFQVGSGLFEVSQNQARFFTSFVDK